MAINPNYFITAQKPQRIDELPIYDNQIPRLDILSEFYHEPTVAKIKQIHQNYPHFQWNTGGRLGWTLLAVAIDRNALPAFHHLLTLDPSLAKKGRGEGFKVSVPHTLEAACRPDPALAIEMLRALTRLGANVNLAGPSGSYFTALFSAARYDTHINVVKFLIKQKGVIYSKAIACKQQAQETDELQKIYSNINRALEEMQAINMFRAGQLQSSRSESNLSHLPQHVRNLIADHIESEYS